MESPRRWGRGVSAWQDIELRALVDQAYGLRHGPYLADAVNWILQHHERRYLRALERLQARRAMLRALLRETNPDRIVSARRTA